MASPVWHFLNGVPYIGPLSIQNTTITLTGPALAADGSESAPSYSFSGDPNTGWFRAGDATTGALLRAAVNGNTRFTVDSVAGIYLPANTASLNFGASNDVSLSWGAANVLTLASGDSFSMGGAPAAATTAHRLIKKVTAMGDGAAVDVFTVTVPNAGQSAGVKVTLVSANGSTDAFESTRVAEGFVAIARTSGVATVATVATLDLAQIATVAAGGTHTLAYGVSAMSGAAGATQTFTITVTVNDSGNVGGNQVVAIAELVNSEATGVTIA